MVILRSIVNQVDLPSLQTCKQNTSIQYLSQAGRYVVDIIATCQFLTLGAGSESVRISNTIYSI
jgi:hypothetical protein